MGNAPQLAEARYGADPKFRAYLDKVPLVVPGLGHVLSLLRRSD